MASAAQDHRLPTCSCRERFASRPGSDQTGELGITRIIEPIERRIGAEPDLVGASPKVLAVTS
jgi:hypothetical protein